MLSTDAYVFLNVDDPLCAWNTVRGELVSPGYKREGYGFVSVWSASLMKNDQTRRFKMELLLEAARRAIAPEKVSRLRGLFCFLARRAAERAAADWGLAHLSVKNLAEVHLFGVGRTDRLDTNWITYSRHHGDLEKPDAWMARYWSGEALPGHEPIWETLVEGRMIILGTELRQRAVEVIKAAFPASLSLLELSRAAAWVGSDLGNIFGWVRSDDENVRLDYYMDMMDAESPDFHRRLAAEKAIVNYHVIKPHIDAGRLGVSPDFRSYGFSRPDRPSDEGGVALPWFC